MLLTWGMALSRNRMSLTEKYIYILALTPLVKYRGAIFATDTCLAVVLAFTAVIWLQHKSCSRAPWRSVMVPGGFRPISQLMGYSAP